MSHGYVFLIFIVAAFFLGSLPTAFIAGKLVKKIDIRQYGSGNVGATNAFRVLGKKIGTVVFLVDFAKGFIPAFWAAHFFLWQAHDPEAAGLWIGICSILGHVFTPFLSFKGGKGIATGAGVLTATFPGLFFIVGSIWLAVFFLSGIVSISSLTALISLVGLSWLWHLSLSVRIVFIAVCLFAIWTHRSNIIRLIQGKENRVIKR